MIFFLNLFSLTGEWIRWILFDSQSSLQQDLPRVKLYDCSFTPPGYTQFFLSGLMSLIRCEFKEGNNIDLDIKKRMYEPEITEETLENAKSNQYQNTIEIIQTKFSVHSLNIYVDNVVRYLKIETVYLNVIFFTFSIGVKIPNNLTAVSVFELKVINCEIASERVQTSLSSLNSFAKFSFQNTVFGKIDVKPDQHEGLVSFVF